MGYREPVMMECFDDRKCFAQVVRGDRKYCSHLVGEPYAPGACPFQKEKVSDRRCEDEREHKH